MFDQFPYVFNLSLNSLPGLGADLIKLYADYPRRRALTPAGTCPCTLSTASYPLFSQEELVVAVKEASLTFTKVAAHANCSAGARGAIEAGVASIEHGSCLTPADFVLMKEKGIIFVPTLAAYETKINALGDSNPWTNARNAYLCAVKNDVEIAAGGDTGVFSHGDNVHEVELMVELGTDVLRAMRAATWVGYKLIRPWPAGTGRTSDVDRKTLEEDPDDDFPRFGRVAPGFLADVVAFAGDPRVDLGCLRRVEFVMKAGVIVKNGGRACLDE